jgi:hypothetical protein
MRFLQIGAFERARKRNFALTAATKRTNIAVNSGASAPGAPLPADFTKNLIRHQLPAIIGSVEMKKVDLYIKVELELDEGEESERVAGEICRQLEKLHFVRRAEVSNSVARE